jgi:signal transduction histidine kinase
MKPLTLKEKEYRLGLLRTERRAIVPLKWIVLIVTIGLWWTLVRPHYGPSPPGRLVYALFAGYMAFTLIETLAFLFGLVGLHSVKPVTLISFLVDVIYVSLLIFFETAPTAEVGGGAVEFSPHTNFSILYFLLVMRGFALFKTVFETILVNGLISVLFVLTIRAQQASLDFITRPEFAVQLILIWLVVLMAWFIMMVINQQKLDLLRAHDQLAHAESLSKTGELAAGVAHEINNPLGVIIATTEYMKKTAGSENPLAEDIEAIHREANRCKDIVQQMLDFAKPKPAFIAPIDAVVINDEVLRFIFPKGRTQGVEIVKEYAEHPLPFQGDADLVKQALLNLYLNARQAIEEKRPGRIVSRIQPARRRSRVAIEIEDDGVGIPDKDLERVFDPFFTSKSNGSGLGLAVTQRIVESFGGSISIEPVKPRGTLVRLEFPALVD